ncbi:hypothetical protein EV580_3143 [Mycobacterium sp. BK086]|uniref:hypothetical protein n=1 Tax=Mycobacterium sp. BK086 TaxID=2512165 RepID=UPI00105C9926|nr:hypothetical protein [Mycobacterium sp. BK086]TDO15003.1 hypothetical protein EV580_3143 [Mycobacterium sp. BK086]
MTITHTPDVALPPGADPARLEEWETYEGSACRLVWSTLMSLPEEIDYDVRVVVASQSPDGAIIVNSAEGPFVHLGDGNEYSSDDARTVATALLTPADLADQWAGKTTPSSWLAIAEAAVREAYAAFRTAPGNAGDYLKAALDCLADAQAVAR